MLGTVRFVLASLVVLNHLWLPTSDRVGAHAVVAFYMVSGFLMTKVIQETYGLSLRGGWHFVLNRALRIYPIYLACMFATLAMLLAFSERFRPYSTITVPDAFDLFRNVTLFNLTPAKSIIVPPAWSLTVEFAFYLMMVALLSRTKLISNMWFAASLVITTYLILSGASFADRYYPVLAASMFFSSGAMLYWHADRLSRLTPPAPIFWPLLAVFCAMPLLIEAARLDRLTIGYYGAALLFLPLFLIANTKPTRMDKWLGDLAYPVFVSHFLCAGIVKLLLPSLIYLSATFMAVSFVLSLVLSIGMVAVQVRTIERLRGSLRQPARDDNDFLTDALHIVLGRLDRRGFQHLHEHDETIRHRKNVPGIIHDSAAAKESTTPKPLA